MRAVFIEMGSLRLCRSLLLALVGLCGVFSERLTAESFGDPKGGAAAIADGAFVLDVRSQSELEEGKVSGSTLIPHNRLKDRLGEIPVEKAEPIVVYCRSGRRASQAEAVLREAGFTNVINGGGYDELEAELRGMNPGPAM